jgi:hypothetical protein
MNEMKIPFPSEEQLIAYREYMNFAKYKSAVFSDLFITQLWIMDVMGRTPACYVMDEVKFIEKIGRKTPTKPSSQFTKPPLAGLWHKHFFMPTFLVKNLCNYLGVEQGHNKNLKRIVSDVLSVSVSECFTEEDSAQIAHKVSAEAFQERANDQKLTGEWIVFGKSNGKNHYLSVASHDEGDEVIFERLQRYCKNEMQLLQL